MKRELDILVLSDLHLGSYGCRAEELLAYLRSVKPRMVVLNGDIIDIWAFKKDYFPKAHMDVVKKLLKWSGRIPVYYITGNHDEALRRYSDARLGRLRLLDQLSLTIDGRRYWFLHGDIFDATMTHAKWLAKLGGFGYDLLIRINHLLNGVLLFMGRPRMSLSRKVKNSVKQAVNFISDFERTMAEIALNAGHEVVVCGHIHQPRIDRISCDGGAITYLNSGDWIENLSALEYVAGNWSLYQHHPEATAVRESMLKGPLRVVTA
jgi:UDP-2,3-diacylglucosamine pyrophosphatase LpxH